MLEALNWVTINDRADFQQTLYKCKIDLAPHYLSVSNIHSYNTCSSSHNGMATVKLNNNQQMRTCIGAKSWNSTHPVTSLIVIESSYLKEYFSQLWFLMILPVVNCF